MIAKDIPIRDYFRIFANDEYNKGNIIRHFKGSITAFCRYYVYRRSANSRNVYNLPVNYGTTCNNSILPGS